MLPEPDFRPRQRTIWHQLAAFLLAGGTAFVVDASVLTILVKLAHFDPFVARVISICMAMVVAWLMNRHWTFAVGEAATATEFLRYAAMAATASALNYAVFAAILLIDGSVEPLTALVVATAVAAVFSFAGMRLVVFRKAEVDDRPETDVPAP